MNVSNSDLGEDLRVIFERVFYHIARQSFDDDFMEMLITKTITMINSVDDINELLSHIDNNVEDLVNAAPLQGFSDVL